MSGLLLEGSTDRASYEGGPVERTYATQIGSLPQLTAGKAQKIPVFLRITTCDHVFDHWGTSPSGISNVCNFEDLHKSRANRFATTRYDPLYFKLSVGSGIEDMVTNLARPIRTVHFENSTDRSRKFRPGRDP